MTGTAPSGAARGSPQPASPTNEGSTAENEDLASWSDWELAESEAASTISEHPEDWNSDDEPPEDDEGDEQVCSRDAKVKKIIRRIGRGWDKPGQYDVVTLRWKELEPGEKAEVSLLSNVEPVELRMGEDRLPLLVELAVKQMRVQEVAEVVGPQCYAALASPLVGRKLRNEVGKLPKQGKVPRKFRFLPMPPKYLALQAKEFPSVPPPAPFPTAKPPPAAMPTAAATAIAAKPADAAESGGTPKSFRVVVEMVDLRHVHMLTEDRAVQKSILAAGHGRRTPRRGDRVWFSLEWTSGETTEHSLELPQHEFGNSELPAEGLDYVLLSMKDGERCSATLPSRPRRQDRPGGKPPASQQLAHWIQEEGKEAKPRQWRYRPPEVRKLELRTVPEVAGPRADALPIFPGDVFQVSEELPSPDGKILFLRLANGRGWVFDRLPGPGVLCHREDSPLSLGPPIQLLVTMRGWRRKDRIPVPLIGSQGYRPDLRERSRWPQMQKLELRPGPEKLPHEVEEGCRVLLAWQVPGAESSSSPRLLSWCMGEGTVPGFMEAAAASMRVLEVSEFEISADCAQRCTQIGPDYQGRTPLREPREEAKETGLPHAEATARELFELAARGFVPLPAPTPTPPEAEAEAEAEASQGLESLAVGLVLREDWPNFGVEISWEDEIGKLLDFGAVPSSSSTSTKTAKTTTSSPTATADQSQDQEAPLEAANSNSSSSCRLHLALLAVAEAPDVCSLPEDLQRLYLERERAHGNALVRLGRWAEASAAYERALDAVRRTAIYKALFPTERGKIEGAYSRDAAEDAAATGAELAAAMTDEERKAFEAGLISLHLNLCLCATKHGRLGEAHRHASVVLAADPGNVKALFRRGSVASSQGNYDEALKDLQKAAELQPQDRTIRDELQTLHRKIKEDRAVQKNMFQRAFQPASRQEQ